MVALAGVLSSCSGELLYATPEHEHLTMCALLHKEAHLACPLMPVTPLCLQLASAAFDKKVREMMCAPGGVPYQGAFRLRECQFKTSSFKTYELDPTIYSEECSLIGKGARGVVKL